MRWSKGWRRGIRRAGHGFRGRVAVGKSRRSQPRSGAAVAGTEVREEGDDRWSRLPERGKEKGMSSGAARSERGSEGEVRSGWR
jgi:hypothetical protein